ncbi:hypothetical protein DL769_004037 [Monosporascus sp. CRB-8-3]|nr:hypothetical protein DL769_004037 [Monosporascus sp. CRB-8-3]
MHSLKAILGNSTKNLSYFGCIARLSDPIPSFRLPGWEERPWLPLSFARETVGIQRRLILARVAEGLVAVSSERNSQSRSIRSFDDTQTPELNIQCPLGIAAATALPSRNIEEDWSKIQVRTGNRGRLACWDTGAANHEGEVEYSA